MMQPGIESELFIMAKYGRVQPEGSSRMLDEVAATLYLTGYQLAAALGVSVPHLQSWRRSERRVSSGYMSRIIKLLVLQRQGVRIDKVRNIDWKTGRIWWRNGTSSAGDSVGDGSWALPRSGKVPERIRSDLPQQYGSGPGPSQGRPDGT